MATTTPYNPNTEAFTQNSLDKTNSALAASNTAFSGDTPPTPGDVALDVKKTGLINSLRQMKGQHINESWYGKTAATNSQPDLNVPENQGFISRALGTLTKPLYGVVGAAESAFGQGIKPDIWANMAENMDEGHRTWGNLLQKVGVPGAISAPLGFGLDITTDPIMMASAGTESLLPKMFTGLVKGTSEGGIKAGLEASGRAFTSNVGSGLLKTADTASTVLKKVSLGFIPKLADEEAQNFAAKAYRNFSDKVFQQGEKFNSLTGYNPLAGLGKGILPIEKITNGVTLGSYVQGLILKIPGGNEFLNKFVYDPYRYNQLVKLNDRIIKIREASAGSTIPADIPGAIKGLPPSAMAGETSGALSSLGESMVQDLNNPDLLQNESEFKSNFTPGLTMTAEQATLKNNIADGIDDTIHIAQQGADSEVQAKNALDLENRLEAEAQAAGFSMDDVERFARMDSQKTGIDWFDKQNKLWDTNIAKFKVQNPWTKKDIAVGEGLLFAVDAANKIFKAAKTTLSPGSHVRNAGTNVFFMHGIGFGVNDITKSLAYIMDANKILIGAAESSLIEKMFIKENTDFANFRSVYPNSFKSTYGLNATMLGGKYFAGKVLNNVIQMGGTSEEVQAALKEMPNEIRSLVENYQGAKGLAKDEAGVKLGTALEKPAFMKPNMFKRNKNSFSMNTPSETTAKAEAVGDFSGSNPTSAIGALDLSHGRFIDYMKAKVAGGSKTHIAIQNMLDNAASSYERKDQAFKLGQSMFLTHHGVPAATLTKMSRMIPDGIEQGDIILGGVLNGQQMYKLTWEKATDIANETYMNYAAMPAFVRMMRKMPVLGAPFVSFTYVAIPKFLKTVYHNPGAFNDVNYALNEFSGNKSPLELKNMQSKYGSWFNSPGMYRVPFFNDRPMYLNLGAFQYQYQLSTMNPSNRSYKEALPNTIVQLVDKLQIAKDPVGQMIFDNVILPLLVPQGERPLSQIGQPIYPLDATGAQKVGYATRNFAEAYVPGALAPLGLAGGLVAPGITQKVPLYNYRKIAEGMQNNKTLGQPSTEGVASLGLKNLAGWAGLPYNNMDLSFLNNTKKKIK